VQIVYRYQGAKSDVSGTAEQVVGDGRADGAHPVGEHADHAVMPVCHDAILPHAPIRDNDRFLAHDVISDAGQEARQRAGSNRHRTLQTVLHGGAVCGCPCGR
jgi:hypothetical protein